MGRLDTSLVTEIYLRPVASRALETFLCRNNLSTTVTCTHAMISRLATHKLETCRQSSICMLWQQLTSCLLTPTAQQTLYPAHRHIHWVITTHEQTSAVSMNDHSITYKAITHPKGTYMASKATVPVRDNILPLGLPLRITWRWSVAVVDAPLTLSLPYPLPNAVRDPDRLKPERKEPSVPTNSTSDRAGVAINTTTRVTEDALPSEKLPRVTQGSSDDKATLPLDTVASSAILARKVLKKNIHKAKYQSEQSVKAVSDKRREQRVLLRQSQQQLASKAIESSPVLGASLTPAQRPPLTRLPLRTSPRMTNLRLLRRDDSSSLSVDCLMRPTASNTQSGTKSQAQPSVQAPATVPPKRPKTQPKTQGSKPKGTADQVQVQSSGRCRDRLPNQKNQRCRPSMTRLPKQPNRCWTTS